MKTIIRNLLAVILFIAVSLETHAQGMVYDQQSATGPNSPSADDFFNTQADSPLLQSFVPSLSAIGFVQFEFWDIPNNGTNGATVYVNLWTGLPNTSSATLIGSTSPVYMPNGFVNDGLGFAGITIFYFSTAIALLTSQTYYLEPVVLSGDNPWAIAVLGNGGSPHDYYPAGDLFERGTDIGIDMWFREGVIVPEPSTLALVGLAGVLVFAFKRHSKLVASLLFAASVLSVQAAQDSVVQVTADAAGLSPAITLPRTGTFWVLTPTLNGRLIALPYPALPTNLSGLPTYSVINNIFIVDDTGGQLMPASAGRMSSAQAVSAARAQAESMAGLIDLIEFPTNGYGTNEFFQSNYTPRSYGSNDLWLSMDGVTNGISYLTIHPPWNVDINTTNWNLLYTTNLTTPFTNWWWILTTDIGQTNLEIANATDIQGFYACNFLGKV